MQQISTDTKIKKLFTEYAAIAGEAGFSAGSDQLKNAIERFSGLVNVPELKIETSYFSGLSPEMSETLLTWILDEKTFYNDTNYSRRFKVGNSTFNFHIGPFKDIDTRLGEVAPLIRILILQNGEYEDADILSRIEVMASHCAYMIVLMETSSTLSGELTKMFSNKSLVFEVYTLDSLPQKKLIARLNEDSYISLLQNVYNYNCLGVLDSFRDIFSMAIEKEERTLTAKKIISQQHGVNEKGKQDSANKSLSKDLNAALALQVKSLEKGIRESYEHYLIPQIGPFAKEMDGIISTMPALQELEKSSTVTLIIQPEFEKEVLDSIYQLLLDKGHEHLVFIRDTFQVIKNDLEDALEKQKLINIPFHIYFLTDQAVVNLLNINVRLDKPYKGSLPKQGILDYMVALSRFQPMLIMIVSTFALFFVKNTPYITVPLILTFFSICIYLINNSIKKEKKENQEKEFEKAKEFLRTETKQIAAEVSKQWMKIISDYLSEQVTKNGQIIENSLATFEKSRNLELEEHERRAKKQIANLDTTQKKIEDYNKFSGQFSQGILQMKSLVKEECAGIGYIF